MKKLVYKIIINAPASKVWDTMLQPTTYREWTNVSWPDSNYEGEWKAGTNIRFIGPDGSGTLASLLEIRKPAFVSAKHIAVLLPGGVEDRDSKAAKDWIGIMENYTFKEKEGRTELIVDIETNPSWQKMFDEGWPNALKKLKEICER
jgi:uncharacterized protein YndB with AHSA1/START domain